MRKGTVAKDNDGSSALVCWQSVFHASNRDRSSSDGLLTLMMLFSCCLSLSLSLYVCATVCLQTWQNIGYPQGPEAYAGCQKIGGPFI